MHEYLRGNRKLTSTTILVFSVLIQFAAAFFAFRLVWITGRRAAWSLISIAILLMAIRRSVTLYNAVISETPYPLELSSELIALVISVIMFSGVALMAPVFISMSRYTSKLKETEDRYRQLVDLSPDSIFIHCGEEIVFVNPAGVESAKADKPEDLIGRSIMDFIRPEDRELVKENIKNILRDGKTITPLKHKLVRLDGSVANVEIAASALKYKGKPAIQVIIRNIDERVEMEDRLYKAVAEQETIIENAVVGIVFVRDRKIVRVNQKIKELFGYAEDDDLAGTSTEIAYESHELFDSLGKAAYPLLAQGKTYDVEMRMKRKDGSIFWARLFGKAIDPDDLSKGAIWLIDDVTERKRSGEERARLMTAVEQAVETILITSDNGTIQYVNPAFEKVTGYTREELVGKNPRMLKSGKHDKAFYEDMWDTLKRGEVWTGYIINKRKDELFYEQETTISPVFDQSGEIANFVAISRDVTREALLSHAKDYFTSITSHELRTPLSKLELVRMLLDSLGEPPEVTDKVKEIRTLLDESYASFDRVISATSLISDLIISRPVDTFVSLNFYFDLLYCVEKARAAVESEGRGVAMSMEMDPSVREARILGDQALFRSAIDEALSNAIKYSPDGESVKVRAGLEDGYVSISIIDHGQGIPPDKRDQVMDPYFSLENPLHHSTAQYSHRGGGIGLGLTIIRMVVEAHKGKISFDNPGEGQGAAITMRFPIFTDVS